MLFDNNYINRSRTYEAIRLSLFESYSEGREFNCDVFPLKIARLMIIKSWTGGYKTFNCWTCQLQAHGHCSRFPIGIQYENGRFVSASLAVEIDLGNFKSTFWPNELDFTESTCLGSWWKVLWSRNKSYRERVFSNRNSKQFRWMRKVILPAIDWLSNCSYD